MFGAICYFWTFCETPRNHLVDFLTLLHKLQREKGKDYFHRRKICSPFCDLRRFAYTQSGHIPAVTHIKILSAEHAQIKCNAPLLGGFVFEENAIRENHEMIVAKSFSKGSVFKMFSVHTTKSRRFQIPLT